MPLTSWERQQKADRSVWGSLGSGIRTRIRSAHRRTSMNYCSSHWQHQHDIPPRHNLILVLWYLQHGYLRQTPHKPPLVPFSWVSVHFTSTLMVFLITLLHSGTCLMHTEILNYHGGRAFSYPEYYKLFWSISLPLFFDKIFLSESTKSSSIWAVFLFLTSFYLSSIQNFTLKTKIISNNLAPSERICHHIFDPYFTTCIIWDPDFFPYKAFIPCKTCFDFWAMLWLPCRPEFARSSLIHADIPSPGIFQVVTTYIDVCERFDPLVGI